MHKLTALRLWQSALKTPHLLLKNTINFGVMLQTPKSTYIHIPAFADVDWGGNADE